MAFSDLKATASLIRSGNSDILTVVKYSDLEIVDLNFEPAYFDLKIELCSQQKIEITNSTILDAIYDKYQNQLEKYLAIRQLFYYYFENNDGDGTLTNERYAYYNKEWLRASGEMAKLTVDNSVNSRFGNVRRG